MEEQEPQRDFDLLEIPLEGVAAYWLSLKKLVGKGRNFKPLEEEAQYTTEPFVRYMLEIGFSGLADAQVRSLAQARRDGQLAELTRKLDLMRMALLDMAHSENPRKTVAKMTSKFSLPPLTEKKAFALAQELVKLAGEGTDDKARYFNVDHRMKCDQLMVTLLFYVIWSRREGKSGCQPFLEVVGSTFFGDGMSLVIDGFDAPFVRERLRSHRETILAETGRKMDLSVELCLGIRNKLTYEDLFLAAKAFLV